MSYPFEIGGMGQFTAIINGLFRPSLLHPFGGFGFGVNEFLRRCQRTHATAAQVASAADAPGEDL